MSKLHGFLLFVWTGVFFAGPVILGVLIDPELLWILGISVVGLFIAWSFGVETGLSVFPVTHKMRARNRQRLCRLDARELRDKACQCRELADTYRSRHQTYDAERLEVEAAHKERLADLRDQDAGLIQREIEDRKMRKLTGEGR